MKFAVIGLGRMGSGIMHNAVRQGHDPIGYDPNAAARERAEGQEFRVVDSYDALFTVLDEGPRILFLYVPHGDPTESVIRNDLAPRLDAGDIVVDAGNSHWEDSIRRHDFLASRGIRFLDMGTSGGISGARGGACFMVGGSRDAFDEIAPLLGDLAVDAKGVLHTGGPGSGHFVKLVHNAIEFGMLQAIGEGVELLERSPFELDLPEVLDNWAHGSVIRSWLVELMRDALRDDADFDELATYVEDTGEVKWMVDWALEQDIPIPVCAEAQTMLMQYRDTDAVAPKAVALMRHGFGGHPLHRSRDGAPAGSRERSR